MLGLVEVEATDQELADEDQGGNIVLRLAGETWARVVHRSSGVNPAALLHAVELNGVNGAIELLRTLPIRL